MILMSCRKKNFESSLLAALKERQKAFLQHSTIARRLDSSAMLVKEGLNDPQYQRRKDGLIRTHFSPLNQLFLPIYPGFCFLLFMFLLLANLIGMTLSSLVMNYSFIFCFLTEKIVWFTHLKICMGLCAAKPGSLGKFGLLEIFSFFL